MPLFKINHDKVITGKLKNIKYKIFLETPKLFFPKPKKISCCFPKQVKIYNFASTTENISVFVFPSKNIVLFCSVFPSKN